jgi:putative transposase
VLYAYTDPLKPDHAPTSVSAGGGTTTFTYDANGNMLTGLGGKIMTYDGENRPLSVTHFGKRTCYVYGVDGKRLKKVEGLSPTQDCASLPAGANTTVYLGSVEIRNWLVAGAEQVLTYPHPAVKLLNGTTPAAATYLHRDGLSSVRAIKVAREFLLRSDNGLVFTSRRYTALVRSYGLKQEFITPHCPQQNGMVERVIRTLKEQCIHRQRFDSIQHATRAIGDWISFCNYRRPHQALDMKTPAEAFALAA